MYKNKKKKKRKAIKNRLKGGRNIFMCYFNKVFMSSKDEIYCNDCVN